MQNIGINQSNLISKSSRSHNIDIVISIYKILNSKNVWFNFMESELMSNLLDIISTLSTLKRSSISKAHWCVQRFRHFQPCQLLEWNVIGCATNCRKLANDFWFHWNFGLKLIYHMVNSVVKYVRTVNSRYSKINNNLNSIELFIEYDWWVRKTPMLFTQFFTIWLTNLLVWSNFANFAILPLWNCYCC